MHFFLIMSNSDIYAIQTLSLLPLCLTTLDNNPDIHRLALTLLIWWNHFNYIFYFSPLYTSVVHLMHSHSRRHCWLTGLLVWLCWRIFFVYKYFSRALLNSFVWCRMSLFEKVPFGWDFLDTISIVL